MLNRTSNFAGLIAGNRYVFGGLEGAFAVAALSFAAAATSGTVESDPISYPFAGMVGSYRTITPVSVESEASGTAGLTFAASGISATAALDLTYPFAGMIGRDYGTISISDTTQFEFFLTATLGGWMDPLTERAFEFALHADLGGEITPELVRSGAGAATLTFSAQGKAGAIGSASLNFAAFGAGVGIGSPFILGAGEAALTFTAAATGQPTWPMSPAASLTFTAHAVSEAESPASGVAALQFTAQGIGYQDGAGAGAASLTFSAAGNSGEVSYAAGEAELTFTASGAAGDRLAEGVLQHMLWPSTLDHRLHLSYLTHG